jgi:hypothetical protein
MRIRHAFVLLPLALAACNNTKKLPPDAPKDVGFNKPTAALHANTQPSGSSTWMDLGPADLTCLGTASTDMPTAVAVTFNTLVKDFQSGNAQPSETVIAFDGTNFSAPFDTKMSDANGNISFTIPAGHTRVGFKMTGDSVMPTFLLNQLFDPNMATQTSPNKIQSVSNATAQTLPALIGETRTAGTGVLAGALRDCQKHEMSNFVATVSSVSHTSTPLAGAEAYYFSAGVDLPVHHSQQDASSADGLFMVIQLPATPTAFVQMWGFKSDGDVASGNLTQIAELQVPVLADTVITGSYEPLRQ